MNTDMPMTVSHDTAGCNFAVYNQIHSTMNTATLPQPQLLKGTVSGAAGIASAFFAPLLPYAFVCTLFVLADCYTAWQLGRRLRRKYPNASGPHAGRLSSRRFGRTIATLIKIYAALILASAAEHVLFGVSEASFSCTRLTAGAICFWQLLSILENESTCSDARWAATARRFLIDKTSRHINLKP